MITLDWKVRPPRWLIGLLSVTLLAACGVRQERPEPIKVPVPVSCIEKRPVRPSLPVVADDDGLFVRTQKLLATVELLLGYVGEQEAVIAACD